ncbi:urease accessory protein UreD [Rhodococcus sp. BP-252]|uniref:urease accessory protein UreD n=1 Tax=unclassified Rhodococcus (in: high G+C Gram-positive bacteria) TaxID=192944 RepID=UPI000DF47113|nr:MULTISPECIES: urease accessory protein UreD [unclassified Rhodococcus (in: high G+C Gram-positive bacteria)]NIL78508.1 Urease accessory protein UreD [Rhodococcus sp. B10]MBY6412012.1 urease accessory protein UreD [Rhodococcus sp. BP-320]MBY6416592.1 urease accessory protein UreD [Rhodococcus sp. BP-321]MBY6421219.1 urease accessory protein UreD [Rhodococcus sp. BP-324]MBY6426616.1 urease accessory protein UreD [Rhodococcus sp. BP-323]
MTTPLALDLSFTTTGARTVFDRRRYRWPQTVGRMFYLDASDPGRGRVIVQNSGASLHPGDRIGQRIAATTGARIEVVGQGAMLVTGVPDGRAGAERTELRVDDGAELAFRPEPRILTAFAHARQDTHVKLGSGIVVLTDAVVVHTEVTAETFGSFRSCVRVTTAGRILALDAQHASSLPSPRSGLRAFATVYLLGRRPDDAVMKRTTAPLDKMDGRSGVYAAVTSLPNGVGRAVRLAATGGGLLRAAMAEVVGHWTT